MNSQRKSANMRAVYLKTPLGASNEFSARMYIVLWSRPRIQGFGSRSQRVFGYTTCYTNCYRKPAEATSVSELTTMNPRCSAAHLSGRRVQAVNYGVLKAPSAVPLGCTRTRSSRQNPVVLQASIFGPFCTPPQSSGRDCIWT